MYYCSRLDYYPSFLLSIFLPLRMYTSLRRGCFVHVHVWGNSYTESICSEKLKAYPYIFIVALLNLPDVSLVAPQYRYFDVNSSDFLASMSRRRFHLDCWQPLDRYTQSRVSMYCITHTHRSVRLSNSLRWTIKLYDCNFMYASLFGQVKHILDNALS